MSPIPLPRPRAAILVPYWNFWEHTIDGDLRGDRLRLGSDIARQLDGAVEVVAVELVDNAAAAAQLAPLLAERRVHVLLVAQTMAVPPTHVLALLDAVPDLPLVVWAAHRTGMVGAAVDHGSITAEGATVGTPMLTNLLIRRRRAFDLVMGRLEDTACVARVREAVRIAGVAGGLRGARIGRVGGPITGYDCVDADPEALQAATGIQIVPIAPREVLARWRAAPAHRVRELTDEVDALWERAPGIDEGDALQRSLRAAVALAGITDLVDQPLTAGQA